MRIAIIAAMGKEVALLLPLLDDKEEHYFQHITYTTGTISGKDVAVMQCGIGKVNAALCTQLLIEAFEPDLVINTGVAGGTGSEAKVLDVVVAEAVAYHDFYALCEPWGTVPECPQKFPTKALKLPQGVKRGLIASGDLFVSQPEEVEHILKLYPEAVAVDMESAAIAQTCYIWKIPFACLRVLSDTPGQHEDNASQYYDFWKEAPEKTFGVLKEILEKI